MLYRLARPLAVVGCIAGGLFLAMLPGIFFSADAGEAADSRSAAAAPMPYSVLDFGATGDGQTDDTAAIQRAVDSSRGDILFPRGVYRISQPIVVDLDRVGFTSMAGFGPARIVMAGPGPAIRFMGSHGGTANPATVKPEVWQRQRTPMVDGLEIVGDHSEACGIEAVRTMQLVVSRTTIRDCLHAVYLTDRNRNVTLSECNLYHNRGVGVYMHNLDLHQVNIANCHISYNGEGGVVVRGSSIRNLQIGTCDIEGNMVEGGPATANVLFDCTAGTMREGAIVGCTIQHTHKAPGSANIRFIGHSAADPRKVGNFAIADNSMSDVAVNVHLQHARGVTLTGNTFWSGFEHDLLVEGSSHIVLGANLFDHNPDYRSEDSDNGLVFRDCSDCVVQGILVNGVKRKEAGLLLERCTGFNITGSMIVDCENCGVLLREVFDSRLSDSILRAPLTEDAQPPALRVVGSANNQIVDNLVRGAVIGVEP